jgi:hypothetical protein
MLFRQGTFFSKFSKTQKITLYDYDYRYYPKQRIGTLNGCHSPDPNSLKCFCHEISLHASVVRSTDSLQLHNCQDDKEEDKNISTIH